MDSAPPGLTVERIHVWRGDRHVLKGVSLALGPGELLQVADRILVMRQGRISGEFTGRCTQEQIMRCAAFESSPATQEEQAG